MHPNSSHTQRPANDNASPRTHSINAAPTLPTLFVMDDGVEKMPVPIIRPTLFCNACQLVDSTINSCPLLCIISTYIKK